MAETQPRALKTYITWTEDLEVELLREVSRIEPFAADHGDLLQRWKLVASGLSAHEPKLNYRGAREHVDAMLKQFKQEDKVQQLSSGTDEDVTDKESEKKKVLESTGDKLCREAEIRVAKRSKSLSSSRLSTGSSQDDSVESSLNDLLEFEKQRHEDYHKYRMERLKFDNEEQRLRRLQSTQLENLVGVMMQFMGNQQK
ncbi:hypothetical protein DYB28_003073 [Aphanomyces astaci]|uniref:Uncharacterized protein n=1 Tax=Aphanomyces astaci TaxID=112090 RepID=A0A397BII9_APHAT|nr:hypothetical protein DYB25_011901 [Aphanomyces astaci]RHY20758.1 hypothetical protein DYB36_011161 [Aphanomyces astaci]RHY50937.1 hypothetical protein DYB34_007263 [Aphanomyces astaci]RHY58805.1 hypothetical protein DYB38_012498 [Aphanomyces astaci]RHY71688.1 hypothetical protein DYB30_007551 [Aphanomyces astaci]